MSGTSDPRRAILGLLAERGPDKTICPSEAARQLAGTGEDFRDYMDPVRNAALELSNEGKIETTQKGQVVDISSAKGPIRLRTRR